MNTTRLYFINLHIQIDVFKLLTKDFEIFEK